MKNTFLLIFLLFTTISLSQIKYEKGYYIDNSNKKVECFIKNMDWFNNPDYINVRLNENGDTKNLSIDQIKEFGIYNTSKYVRAKVKMDRSSEIADKISSNRNPTFNEELLFLNVLVEGDATLYLYEDHNLKRFFFNKDNDSIKQLVFKSYIIEYSKVGENNHYKQQLLNNLKCPSIKISRIKKLDYDKEDLRTLFEDYNNCGKEKTSKSYEDKYKRDLFNLSLRPRLVSSSINFVNELYNYHEIDFGNKTNIDFGIEAELILPFNKNKWSIFIEPTYHSYKNEISFEYSSLFAPARTYQAEVKYSSIEAPLGIRYSLFLNDESKVFINIAYVIDTQFKSSYLKINDEDGSNLTELDLYSDNNWAFGAGYKFLDKYTLEVRYQTSRSVSTNYANWFSDHESLSLIIGYSFL